jgi:hypothetical protein
MEQVWGKGGTQMTANNISCIDDRQFDAKLLKWATVRRRKMDEQ